MRRSQQGPQQAGPCYRTVKEARVQSVEITLNLYEDAGVPRWRVAVETFDAFQEGLAGQQMFGGEGLSMTEDIWLDISTAAHAQILRMLTGEMTFQDRKSTRLNSSNRCI